MNFRSYKDLDCRFGSRLICLWAISRVSGPCCCSSSVCVLRSFPTADVLAARRTWAVRDDGRRCGSSCGRVFPPAAAARRAPLRRKSFLPLGALRGNTNRGLCRRRREPETPRSAFLCRSSSKSTPSSAVLADELERNREIFQFGEGVWLHPDPW